MAKSNPTPRVPNQGGVGKANVAPSRTGVGNKGGTHNSPGLSPDASKTNVRPGPVGGSSVKNQSSTGGPKPFKK